MESDSGLKILQPKLKQQLFAYISSTTIDQLIKDGWYITNLVVHQTPSVLEFTVLAEKVVYE